MKVQDVLQTGILDKKQHKVTLDTETRMRILANLIIDRILEDKKKGLLKVAKKSDILEIDKYKLTDYK